MRFFKWPASKRSSPDQLIDYCQVVDYCWDVTLKDALCKGSEEEIQEQIDKFSELLVSYLHGERQFFTGAIAVKKEDVNALL